MVGRDGDQGLAFGFMIVLVFICIVHSKISPPDSRAFFHSHLSVLEQLRRPATDGWAVGREGHA